MIIFLTRLYQSIRHHLVPFSFSFLNKVYVFLAVPELDI